MKAGIARIACLSGLLLAAAGGAFGGAGYAANFLFGCCVFVVLYSLAVSIWMRGDITVERIMNRRHITAGDELEVTMKVNLPFRCPLCWIIVEERWLKEQTGREESFVRLLLPRGRRKIAFQYKLPGRPRGVYRVYASCVAVGDMLHLSMGRRIEREKPDGEVVTVLPRPLAGSWYGGLFNGNAEGDFGTIRDYVHGDPIRSIDWKSFARHQKLKTKQLDAEEGKSSVFVLDAEKESDAGFERMICAAARLIKESAGHVEEVMLVCGNHKSRFALGRESCMTDIFEWLASVEPIKGRPFRETMDAAIALAERGSVVIGFTGKLIDERLIAVFTQGYRNITAELVYVTNGAVLSISERRTLGQFAAAGCHVHTVPGFVAGREDGRVTVHG